MSTNMKRFFVLWAGELVSTIGSGLTTFGLAVYVFRQTGMVTATALVSLAALLPTVLLGPVAGVLADRYDRRVLMIVGDSLSALGLIYILFCVLGHTAGMVQICAGVGASSFFAALLEPAYRSTITDLLPEEEYAKASGLVQIAGSAKFLISPFLAGFLMKFSGIELILMLDICTFFLTVGTTLFVKKKIAGERGKEKENFLLELKEGMKIIYQKKGIFLLILLSAGICFFLTFIQTLCAPMILSFTDEAALGICETLCACGMLVSSMVIGICGIKKGYVKILFQAMFCDGICMMFFGLRENIYLVTAAGFIFFAALPFANTSLDFLVRKHIPNEFQGRAWGIIGLISQMGYVIANACIGSIADLIFEPAMGKGGILAGSLGNIMGTGAGRGTALLIMTGGLFLCVTAVMMIRTKPILELEKS